jgi:hypothetical protein
MDAVEKLQFLTLPGLELQPLGCLVTVGTYSYHCALKGLELIPNWSMETSSIQKERYGIDPVMSRDCRAAHSDSSCHLAEGPANIISQHFRT